MKKLLCRFKWESRWAMIEGLFVTNQTELEKCYGKELYLGEVEGKHSCVEGKFEPNDITVVSTDQDLIEKLLAACGCTTICGVNPIEQFENQ